MPQLEATAKLANLEGSIRQYVSDNLAATFSSGAAIDYGSGEPFLDVSRSEWLQVRLLDSARPKNLEGPRGPDGNFARELFVMLNLNIFIRPAKLSTLNSLRLQTLRDTVRVYFTHPTRIRVKDYAGDSSTLGYLICHDVEADRQISDPAKEQELLQWNMIISLRWSETERAD